MRQNLLTVMLKVMDAMKVGVTISDAAKPDCPLIYANKEFLKFTGYTYKEVIGKNCRFLQGADTDKRTIKEIHSAILNKKRITVPILNYTKKGKPFWNNLSLFPIFNSKSDVTHFVGLQEVIINQKQNTVAKEDSIFKQIAASAINVQEEEGEKIGKELHDNTSQLLATCKLYLNVATTEEELRLPMIQQTMSVIDMAIKELGELSRTLVKSNFKEDSLKESLETLIENEQCKAQFSTSYSFKKVNEKLLSATKKLLLYRAVQVQLKNISTHATAKNVSIDIFKQNHQVHLSIKDDGLGFNPFTNIMKTGLKDINNRVMLEGGVMQLNAASGNGCEIKIILPL